KRAKGAVAALGHVDIEDIRPQLDGGAVRREDLRLLFSTFLGLNDDAVRGADAGALPAADAVFDLVKEARPGSIRQIPFHRRVLKGHRRSEEMIDRDLHRYDDRHYAVIDFAKVVQHIMLTALTPG